MKKNQKRKICFPITSRAYYGRIKPLLKELQSSRTLELQTVLSGAVVLDKYSKNLHAEIMSSGMPVSETLFNIIEGGNHVSVAKSACLTALEFINILHRYDSDIVVIVGDRFEQLSIAMAAAYMNKTIAHIEGGDLTGSIDESIRHAITKLAHHHFVTNKDAYHRVIRMGENPKNVYHVGSLDIESVASINTTLEPNYFQKYGVGSSIDLSKPYMVVVLHPVSTEQKMINRQNTIKLFDVIKDINIQTVWFWPNNDAGTDEVSEAIRHIREQQRDAVKHIHFVTNIPAEDYLSLLRGSTCLAGNSSSGIKECSFLGVPVVNIGMRQQMRLRGQNVKDVSYDAKVIAKAIREQIAHGPYKSSKLYHEKGTSKKIAKLLASAKLYTQKKFFE